MTQLDRDGVVLHFIDVGKGAPPLVLLHGLGRDHAFFAPQIEHFRREHRVVAVDLRGHGQSGGQEQECTVSVFADDIAWLCYELGVYAPVIVGHGLGGQVGLEVAARYPDLPAAIVALDSLILPPPETYAVLRRSLPAEFAAADAPRAVTSAWRNALIWDGAAAVVACEVPLLYIDSGSNAADLEHLGELCPRLTIGRTCPDSWVSDDRAYPGCSEGCWVSGDSPNPRPNPEASRERGSRVESSRQVNAMIDGFLARLLY